MKDNYFEILINLAKKASKKDEVPISALLVKDNKIIAKSYNHRERNNNILNHAEIMVLKKASQRLKTWHLDECDLYVTLKPCKMCEAAINQSHIKNVYYLLEKDSIKKEYSKTKYIQTNVRMYNNSYQNILSSFFKNKRDKTK